MQVVKNVDYDPLDHEIDLKSIRFIKNPFAKEFSFNVKIRMCLDSLFEDSNMNKEEFKKIVYKNLIEF